MLSKTQVNLIKFLQEEMGVSSECIAQAQNQLEDKTLLAMILWQEGIISLEQLEQVFNWLEKRYSTKS